MLKCCGLIPPLDLQVAGLSIEGRAVPDYGAPFKFLVCGDGPAVSFKAGISLASTREGSALSELNNNARSWRDAGATKTASLNWKTADPA
jgi:hypothetical protein